MKYDKTKIKPTINGLSDHNTKIISLENINNVLKKKLSDIVKGRIMGLDI